MATTRTSRRFVINKVDKGSAEAEDLIQQVFLACVEGRERIETRASFRAYLLGIARHKICRHWERRRKGVLGIPDSTDEDLDKWAAGVRLSLDGSTG